MKLPRISLAAFGKEQQCKAPPLVTLFDIVLLSNDVDTGASGRFERKKT